jgi:hypothetical protein
MSWFVATIAACPTNFTTPFTVAIEGRDLDHAKDRLYKLYSNDIYSGIGQNMSEAIRETSDPDEMENARKHPMK